MSKKFQKKQEDFVCQQCGRKVIGNGYTNHCPSCLWSKHVDINPGDRSNSCGGMMKPIDAYWKKQTWRIVHQCQKCGTVKEVNTAFNDSWPKLEEIIKRKLNLKQKTF